MKITLLQTDIAWKKPEENEVNAERMILSALGQTYTFCQRCGAQDSSPTQNPKPKNTGGPCNG